MFPQVLDKLGKNTPGLSDSGRVSLIAGLGGTGAASLSKGMDSNGYFAGWRGCFLPNSFFFLFILFIAASLVNVKEWPFLQHVGASCPCHCCVGFQLDAPTGLRSQMFCHSHPSESQKCPCDLERAGSFHSIGEEIRPIWKEALSNLIPV
jgi:hypothetical protein